MGDMDTPKKFILILAIEESDFCIWMKTNLKPWYTF